MWGLLGRGDNGRLILRFIPTYVGFTLKNSLGNWENALRVLPFPPYTSYSQFTSHLLIVVITAYPTHTISQDQFRLRLPAGSVVHK